MRAGSVDESFKLCGRCVAAGVHLDSDDLKALLETVKPREAILTVHPVRLGELRGEIPEDDLCNWLNLYEGESYGGKEDHRKYIAYRDRDYGEYECLTIILDTEQKTYATQKRRLWIPMKDAGLADTDFLEANSHLDYGRETSEKIGFDKLDYFGRSYICLQTGKTPIFMLLLTGAIEKLKDDAVFWYEGEAYQRG